MVYKMIAVLLVAVLLEDGLAAQDQGFQLPRQTVAQIQQVLRKAQEKDKPVKVTLVKKIDNQKKLSGKVSAVSDTGFTLANQKTGETTTVAYDDVKEVSPKGMSRGEKIATGVAIAGAFFLVMILLWRLGVIKGND